MTIGLSYLKAKGTEIGVEVDQVSWAEGTASLRGWGLGDSVAYSKNQVLTVGLYESKWRVATNYALLRVL